MRLFLLLLFLLLVALLGEWAGLSAWMGLGFALAAAGILGRTLVRGTNRGAQAGCFISWAAGTAILWIAALAQKISFDTYYAILAALMAVVIGLSRPGGGGDDAMAKWWKRALMGWIFCAAFIWLGAGYFQNNAALFHSGLAAVVATLVLCRCWFSPGAAAIQIIYVLIFLLAGLPVADFAARHLSQAAIGPDNCQLFYSCDAAHGDPAAFARWTAFYDQCLGRMASGVFTGDTNGAGFRLKPGSRALMMESEVAIDSLGFRGPEIPLAKGHAYRIVALGESTTFGVTLRRGDRPWPEMLQEIIRQRLHPPRPVQVINAGTPGYSLFNNLARLARDILPLHPDMIISYHGANGFNTIDKEVLPPLGPIPPVYRVRPLKLAADVEHRLRLMLFYRRALPAPAKSAGTRARPMQTAYAQGYVRLVKFCRSNHIRLTLANYSMAVNASSDSRVLDFYQGAGQRASYAFVRANGIHSLIVSTVAQQFPEVHLIDTHPGLDGQHEKFIDVLHFTNEGRRQMAENMYVGIEDILKRDLSAR